MVFGINTVFSYESMLNLATSNYSRIRSKLAIAPSLARSDLAGLNKKSKIAKTSKKCYPFSINL